MNQHLKDAARALIRPFWHKIWARIEVRLTPVEAHLAALDARLTSVEARLAALAACSAKLETNVGSLGMQAEALVERLAPLEAGWREHSPAFLNAASTIRALGHELVRTKNGLSEEIRQLKAELESGFGPSQERMSSVEDDGRYQEPPCNAAEAPPRVRSLEKLAEAGAKGLRLNLGCGRKPIKVYVNVDRRDLPGVDIIAEVDNIPLAAGSVQEIYSSHMLQYFSDEELRRRLFPYWRALLAPGGEFRAVVPDAEAMLAGIAEGTYEFVDFRNELFGGRACESYPHRNLFKPRGLVTLLKEAGFGDVEVPTRARHNGKSFEFEIIGVKR